MNKKMDEKDMKITELQKVKRLLREVTTDSQCIVHEDSLKGQAIQQIEFKCNSINEYKMTASAGKFSTAKNKKKTAYSNISHLYPCTLCLKPDDVSKGDKIYVRVDESDLFSLPILKMSKLVTIDPPERDKKSGREKWSVNVNYPNISIKFRVVFGPATRRSEALHVLADDGYFPKNWISNPDYFSSSLVLGKPAVFVTSADTYKRIEFSGNVNGAAVRYEREYPL